MGRFLFSNRFMTAFQMRAIACRPSPIIDIDLGELTEGNGSVRDPRVRLA